MYKYYSTVVEVIQAIIPNSLFNYVIKVNLLTSVLLLPQCFS
jgi:hypothetical protein